MKPRSSQRPGSPPVPPSDSAAVDPESGEYIEPADIGPSQSTGPSGNAPTAASVEGERTIPSVNRERSVRSRVSNALAIGTLAVLGGGLLVWYYASQFSRAHDARDAERKAAEQRSSGEMRLAPLGRVDPPRVETAASAPSGWLGPAPAAPPMPQPVSAQPAQAAPQKTPAQLALERKLGQPVLMRSHADGSAPAVPATVTATGRADPAALMRIFGPAAGVGAAGTTASTDAGATPLSNLMRPTPTPAVTAQMLPTRRFLLPKSAFVDCTLETAIDSTFDGMTTCIGANDVYSADGKVVLLERGTKYVGEKRGEVRQGQGRVFVLWNEARTPTGVVVNLASPGTDELGRTGLPGFVDKHFWDRFGAAILISVIDGTLQALANSQQRGGDTAVVISPQGGRDVMTEVLKDTVAIPPTVVKNQGDRIQILVARDVDFRSVYALRGASDER